MQSCHLREANQAVMSINVTSLLTRKNVCIGYNDGGFSYFVPESVNVLPV
jgi:hypothetical protein